MSKSQVAQGLSDALGMAEKVDGGASVRLYHATEFFLDGIRFNPGTYEIRKVLDAKNDAVTEQPF